MLEVVFCVLPLYMRLHKLCIPRLAVCLAQAPYTPNWAKKKTAQQNYLRRLFMERDSKKAYFSKALILSIFLREGLSLKVKSTHLST